MLPCSEAGEQGVVVWVLREEGLQSTGLEQEEEVEQESTRWS